MKKTIFFVEDEHLLVQTLSEFFRSKGYIVEAAYDGKQALEMLPTVKPDLILLDLVIPEVSGIDFLRQLQKDGSEFSDVPVVVLTNLQGDEENFNKLGLKVVGYCVKANTPLEELAKIIEKVFKK